MERLKFPFSPLQFALAVTPCEDGLRLDTAGVHLGPLSAPKFMLPDAWAVVTTADEGHTLVFELSATLPVVGPLVAYKFHAQPVPVAV